MLVFIFSVEVIVVYDRRRCRDAPGSKWADDQEKSLRLLTTLNTLQPPPISQGLTHTLETILPSPYPSCHFSQETKSPMLGALPNSSRS